jgi:hypothetical protein
VLPSASGEAPETEADKKLRERKAVAKAQVDVTLDPDELETMDAEVLYLFRSSSIGCRL